MITVENLHFFQHNLFLIVLVRSVTIMSAESNPSITNCPAHWFNVIKNCITLEDLKEKGKASLDVRSYTVRTVATEFSE